MLLLSVVALILSVYHYIVPPLMANIYTMKAETTVKFKNEQAGLQISVIHQQNTDMLITYYHHPL